MLQYQVCRLARLHLENTDKLRDLFYCLWCNWRPNDTSRQGRLYWVHVYFVIMSLTKPYYTLPCADLRTSLNTPPSVAPLISGLLLIRWSWPSIFWFLSIASLVVFSVMTIYMAETCRIIVGNGSGTASWTHRPLVSTLTPPSAVLEESVKPQSKSISTLINPLETLKLLKNHATLLAVVCYGFYYTIYSCLQASLSTVFVEIYGVTGLVAGFIYIPFGVACVLAAFLAGRCLASYPFFDFGLT